MKTESCVLLILCLFGSRWSVADTYIVRPDGSGDFPNIQAALDASADGDTIQLADGTFTGLGNRDLDFHGKRATVTSRMGDPVGCMIDCEGLGRGFYFHSQEGPESRLEGVTLTRGLAYEGGAILCYEGSSPSIRRCTFVDNGSSPGSGAGILCGYDCSLDIQQCEFRDHQGTPVYGEPGAVVVARNCSFADNAASFSGAIEVGNNARLECYGCVFTHCEAYATIRASFCDVVLDDCVFLDNVNGNTAVSLFGVNFTVHACRFEGNSANFGNAGGGALGASGSGEVTNCVFARNSSDHGGGAEFDSGDVVMRSCLFVGNAAGTYGGACVLGGAGSKVIENCTMVGNSAVWQGNALFCDLDSQVDVGTTIIASGSGGAPVYCNEGGGAILSCCDVYGNDGGDWIGCIAGQEHVLGNFSADPLFCGTDQDDFTLFGNSPCLPGNHPDGVDCGLIGAFGRGCEATPIQETTWGRLKMRYSNR